MAERFKSVFSAQELNRLGKEVRYCQRDRVVTPFRLVMAMLSSGKVETRRTYNAVSNALLGGDLAYMSFHNQLFKRGFARFMRVCVERLIEKLVLNSQDRRDALYAGWKHAVARTRLGIDHRKRQMS